MEGNLIQTATGFTAALTGLSAFLACMIGFPVTIRLSRAFGLVDLPSGRKNHHAPTPLVGGITFYLAFLVVSALFAKEWLNVSMILWIGIVLAIGIYDDYRNISALSRIAAHSLVIIGIFYTDGLLVNNIGDLLGNGPVMFITPVAIGITIVSVIGAINSVNMVDGVDGLLGSLAVVSLFTLLMIAIADPITAGNYKSFATADVCTMLGALCAFLIYNSRFFKRKQAAVFMGDAGSTAIGFCLVYLLIDYSQGNNQLISPVTAGWILGLPLLDASAVIGKRILSGKSPLKPGRDHLHHLLIDSGMSVNQAVGRLVFLHCIMVLVGVSTKFFIESHADLVLFWAFVGLVLLRIIFTDNVATMAQSTNQ